MNPALIPAYVAGCALVLAICFALLFSGALNPKDDDEALYECRPCGLTFDSLTDYVGHLRECHQGVVPKC